MSGFGRKGKERRDKGRKEIGRKIEERTETIEKMTKRKDIGKETIIKESKE